jgi:hypothetical protein
LSIPLTITKHLDLLASCTLACSFSFLLLERYLDSHFVTLSSLLFSLVSLVPVFLP